MMKALPLLLTLFALSACDMMIAPWKWSDVRNRAAEPLTCATGNDCDEKWERAKTWAKRTARYPLVQKTDRLIKTSKATKGSPDPAFTITRKPISDVTEEIILDAGCDNLFGCIPAIPKLKVKFKNFVLQREE